MHNDNHDNTPAVRRTVQGFLVPQTGIAPVPRRIQAIQHLATWKNSPEHDHAWLCKVIGSTLQTFVMMALPGQPAAEMLPMTAQVWAEVLIDMNLQEDLDRKRLETAVRLLTRKLKEWPQIADLIEVMPHREDTSPAAEIREQVGVSEAGQRAGLEALAKMKKEMGI